MRDAIVRFTGVGAGAGAGGAVRMYIPPAIGAGALAGSLKLCAIIVGIRDGYAACIVAVDRSFRVGM